MDKRVKIKLLRMVGIYRNKPHPLWYPIYPPLALGILFAQIKNNGYDVSQDDLNIRVHYDNFNKSGDKQFKFDLFFQEERIKTYANSGTDTELEIELGKTLECVDIENIDIFLLSIPESPFNSSNILFTIAFSKFLKKKYSPQIVVGGDITSIEMLKTKYNIAGIIDYIVIGEGEDVVIDVVDRIICHRDNKRFDEIIIVERLSNKKKIIVPDFSGLPLEKYRFFFLDYDNNTNMIIRDFFISDTSILLFQFIQGCPNTCAFCGSSASPMGLFLKPDEVVDAVYALQKRFKPTGYLFMNDTDNISKTYIKNICELICKKNINLLWSASVRVNGLDEEVIAKMREAGCIRLILGMETASPVF